MEKEIRWDGPASVAPRRARVMGQTVGSSQRLTFTQSLCDPEGASPTARTATGPRSQRAEAERVVAGFEGFRSW